MENKSEQIEQKGTIFGKILAGFLIGAVVGPALVTAVSLSFGHNPMITHPVAMGEIALATAIVTAGLTPILT